ncbi:hypothetical protein SLE2022_004780 [Rubroshorea leprosula]
MANEVLTDSKQDQERQPQKELLPYPNAEEDDESDSEPEEDQDSSSTDDDMDEEIEPDLPGNEPRKDAAPETYFRRLTKVLESKRYKALQEEEERRRLLRYVPEEVKWDFPEDPERWREEDVEELWADAPLFMTKPGWDPVWADEEDWEVVNEEIRAGRDPPIAPFYVPFRKTYPPVPKDDYDIKGPKGAVEELDRIEEFLTWVSYIFPDGSTYEGTVWDDLAHGKGVYVAEQGLVRYEGEWLQNNMEGHGVVEVDIPGIEPVPGSKLEAKMRAEGKIIQRDFMTPEDREWLEMDIEDSLHLAGKEKEIPFYENDEWIRQFGRKPEKGRYRYAGQWKHGRMHGCGVYEVNERTIYGRFYFGELLDDFGGCDENISAMHSGIAEVAAAKARMFVNKPDGMVREERGPYSDPQHPYFYEEEDVWMAPGFINQFYEVPDYWKTYVHEVDQEREMWLNSFYKAPLRLPMPAELEYWWSKDEAPEFILVNKEPEPDPEDPTKLVYTEDPLILHTRTGRLINYIEDEKYGVRLFWQPPLKEGEDVDAEKAEFLPLGFDEFYGQEEVKEKENMWKSLIVAVENALKPVLDKLEKWSEEKKKASEMKLQLIEKELELIEAELCLEEALEDLDEKLKMREKEEEKKAEMRLQQDEDSSLVAKPEEKASNLEEVGEDEDGYEEDEEEDDVIPSSFGSVADQESKMNDQKGKKPGESPFSSSSLSFASFSLVSAVPSRLQQSILSFKRGRLPLHSAPSPCVENSNGSSKAIDSVSFPPLSGQKGCSRVIRQEYQKFQPRNRNCSSISQLNRSLCKTLSCPSASSSAKRCLKAQRTDMHGRLHAPPNEDLDTILCLHMPLLSDSQELFIRIC